MKLLDKQTIAVQKSTERKREVEEGIKLAKSVDNLRETLSGEQANLRKFRDSTLKLLKDEIDVLINKKNLITSEITALEEKRRIAEAPIDLTIEWKSVEIAKKEVEDLKQELFNRETVVIGREVAVHALDSREKELNERDLKSENYLVQSRKTYEITENLRRDMEERKLKFDTSIDIKEQEIKSKEQELVLREHKVLELKNDIESLEKKLLDKETSLIERNSILNIDIKSLAERELKVKDVESLTKRLNDEASHNHEFSENLKRETEQQRKEFDLDIKNRYTELTKKEQDFGYKERDLILEKEQLEIDRKEIEKERLHIKSQQQTLKVAWDNIKKLQK